MRSFPIRRSVQAAAATGVVALMLAVVVSGTTPAAAITGEHGCFKVIGADSVNVRIRPFARAEVVGVINKGETVGKWRRFCALRGFWCPVESDSGVKGWADKDYLDKMACPAS